MRKQCQILFKSTFVPSFCLNERKQSQFKMPSVFTLLAFFVVLISVSVAKRNLTCFVCDSTKEAGCIDRFDILKPHKTFFGCDACSKLKGKDTKSGAQFVQRGCESPEQTWEDECVSHKTKEGSGDLCTCLTNFCNAAPGFQGTLIGTILIVTTAILL